jgi:hypothetical protein
MQGLTYAAPPLKLMCKAVLIPTFFVCTQIFTLAAQLIGPEALVSVPDSARYSAAITWQPATNESVSLNPPVFSWPYMEDPSYSANHWTMPYQYQFQISSNATFTQLAVNKRCVFNFWNLIGPLPSPFYWRVGYIPSVLKGSGLPQISTTTTNWSAIRTNFIANDAVEWDRHFLTNRSYLASKMQHPFYSVTDRDRTALTNYLFACLRNYYAQNGTLYQRQVGLGWLSALQTATNAINACWWTVYDPTATTNVGCSAIGNAAWAESVSSVCYAFQLTRWSVFSNAAPWNALNRLAQRYLDGNWDQYGNINLEGCCAQGMNEVRALGKGYDWVYPWLSGTQRTNILAAIEGACQWQYYSGNFLIDWAHTAGWRNVSRVFTNSVDSNSYVSAFAIVRKNTSHGHTLLATVFGASIAAYGDVSSTNTYPQSGAARDYFELGVNWLIAKGYWAGQSAIHQSRGYGEQGVGDNRGVQNLCLLDRIFPEMQFARTPWLSSAADWFDRTTPPGHSNPYDPWGEGGEAGYYLGSRIIYRTWAFLLNSIDTDRGGILWQRHVNMTTIFPGRYDEPEELSVPYYYAAPVAKNSGTNPMLFPNDGWFAATTLPANTRAAFTNGVGLIFWARPYGGYSGAGSGSHTYCNDGNFEAWAYGANVTSGGKGNVGEEGQPSWMHNTIAVNGLGQAQSTGCIPRDYYAKIIAFTNSDNSCLVGGDLTYAYPHDNVLAQNGPARFNTLHNYGSLSGLKSMKRFILWPRKKYFVIYDDMAMNTNSTFSWVYHIQRQTTSINTNAISFSYVATNIMGGSVTTYVAHAVNSASMSLTNLTGTNVYGNPITGENYAWSDPYPRAHAIWVSNRIPTKNWHFLSVIYPVKPGSAAPQINRLDDYTVEITNGDEHDVISFDPNTTRAATLVVDIPALSNSSPRPLPPQALHTVSSK